MRILVQIWPIIYNIQYIQIDKHIKKNEIKNKTIFISITYVIKILFTLFSKTHN